MLPYYLNAPTNLLDKDIATKIVTLFTELRTVRLPKLENGDKYIGCGMEMAGGIIAAQLDAAAAAGCCWLLLLLSTTT